MKLKVENGRVPCLVVAGKDVVSSSLDENFALQLLEKADTVETTDTHKGFPLFVNGLYYLPSRWALPSLTPNPAGRGNCHV